MPVRGAIVGRQKWFYDTVQILEAAGFTSGAPGVYAAPGFHYFSRRSDEGCIVVVRVQSKTRLEATFPDGRKCLYRDVLAFVAELNTHNGKPAQRAHGGSAVAAPDILGAGSVLSIYATQLAPHREMLQSFVDEDGVPTNLADGISFLDRVIEEIGMTEGVVPGWLVSVREIVAAKAA